MSAEKGFSLNLKKKFCPGKVIKHLDGILRGRENEIALVYTGIVQTQGRFSYVKESVEDVHSVIIKKEGITSSGHVLRRLHSLGMNANFATAQGVN